jgi:anaerobic C4-dicarboxylate transporter DcuA
VSAASAALLTVLAPAGIKLADILLICIPSTIIGVIVGILFVWKRGKELNVDPEFIERMKDPAFAKNVDAGGNDTVAVLKPGATEVSCYFWTRLYLVLY